MKSHHSEEVIERGFENTPDNRQKMYDKFKTYIPTHSMASKKWKRFCKGCREIMELFQIYEMAADKAETQTRHSFSALMQVHEQLLKTSVERKMSRYNGRIFMTDATR